MCRFGGRLFSGSVNVSCDGCPAQADSDNDGLNNANELALVVNTANPDFDGVVDGDDVSNGNGRSDEHEDDGDGCPDPDGDGNGIDDEDEDD